MANTLKGKFDEIVAALGTPATDLSADIAAVSAALAVVDALVLTIDTNVGTINTNVGAMTDVAGDTSVVALLKAIKVKTDTIV